MKLIPGFSLLVALAFPVQAAESLNLANDPWPPFVIEGEEAGTAEALVCEALRRSGWDCDISVDHWSEVLAGTRSGERDGVVAIWKSEERETYLVFSDPYLTNRMIAITAADSAFRPSSLGDLAGRRVALVADFAYGDEITAARESMDVTEVEDDLAAIQAVQSGQAQAAIIDELIARQMVDDGLAEGVTLSGAALSFRELHFAVSRQHPQAQQIVDDFNQSFQVMLEDGTVNEILEIDWLVTDVGRDGDLDFVLRASISPDQLADPHLPGGVYAPGQSDHLELAHPEWQTASPGYQVGGVEHDSLSAALESAYGRKRMCGYEQWSSHIVCAETKTR